MFDNKLYYVDNTKRTAVHYDDTELRNTMEQIHKEEMENSRRVDISMKEYEELVKKSKAYDRLTKDIPPEIFYNLEKQGLNIKGFYNYQILERATDPFNPESHVLSLNYMLERDMSKYLDYLKEFKSF